MIVRYGVLGLLVDRPGYGYDLTRRLCDRLGPTWQLSRSLVYASLDQLADAGLIREAGRPNTGSALRGPGGRTVYEPTQEGGAFYAAWISRPSNRFEPIRSELRLKIACATPADSRPLLSALEHEERMIEDQMKEVQDIRHQTPSNEQPWAETARLALVDGAVSRLHAELEWLRGTRHSFESICKSG